MRVTHAIPRGAARNGAASPAGKELSGGTPLSCGLTRLRGRAADTLTTQIAAFNLINPVGTAGYLLRDNGQAVPTKVTAPAILFAGDAAVARFEGLRGFFSIDRFTTGEDVT